MIDTVAIVVAIWVGVTVSVGFASGYLIGRRPCLDVPAMDDGPIDLATLPEVDLINLAPGQYVTTRPVEVLAGSTALRVDVDDLLVVRG
jgi:hypothetical protein